jgi:hypothetical protein
MAEELEQQGTGAEEVGLTDQSDVSVGGDSDANAGGSQETGEQFYDVGGEKLSLQQLQEGYLRTADYTRKTQELAQQRESLKQYQEMEQYLKANPQKAQQIYNMLNGTTNEYGEVDPVKQELLSVKQQTQYMAQQLSRMETEKLLDEVNRDPKYGEMFKDSVMEKALLSTHMQLGRRGSLKETAEEMFKVITRREVDAKKKAEDVIKQNLSSATRKSGASGGKAMNTPKAFSPSSMSERDLDAEALKMLG